jgi:hypothetical protein
MIARNGVTATVMAATANPPAWLSGSARTDWRPIDEAKLTGLTAGDRWSVATALATTDVCLIESPSAGERIRIAQTIAKLSSERVLLLAPELIARDNCQCVSLSQSRSIWARVRGLFGAGPPTKCAQCADGIVVTATYRHPPADRFPLLIALDAHTLDETGLQSVARLADRCVIVGEPGRSLFTKMCERFACEPWVRGERLICRLHPVADDQRGGIESELVADRPEIELRILADSGDGPQLVEVVFPADTPIADAKRFVFEQLGEAPLCGSLCGANWSESAEAIALELGETLAAPNINLVLADGVNEFLSATERGWTTNGVRFAKSAGWTIDSAKAWIDEHCRRHDRSRVVRFAPSPAAETQFACSAETIRAN